MTVFLAGSGGEFLGGQVLFNDVLKADGHGDNSWAVDMHLHDRRRQPIAVAWLLAEPPVAVGMIRQAADVSCTFPPNLTRKMAKSAAE